MGHEKVRHVMLSFLIGILNPLGKIADRLQDAYEAKLRAENDKERIAADIRVKQLEAKMQVLIAEQKNRLTRWIRPAFALPFVIYDFKIVVWDKVLGLGSTDALSPEFWQLQMIVFGAYFLTRPFEKR
jgi:hypothetical protein